MGAPILEPPKGDGDESRRSQLVEPFFRDAQPNQVVAILKAGEPARILLAMGDRDNPSPPLEYQQRSNITFSGYPLDSGRAGQDTMPCA